MLFDLFNKDGDIVESVEAEDYQEARKYFSKEHTGLFKIFDVENGIERNVKFN